MGDRPDDYWRLATIGLSFIFTLVGGMVAGGLIGGYLDKRFGTDPYLTAVGVFLGMGAAFQLLLRELIRSFGRDGSAKENEAKRK